jgi:hypothetical protein
MVHIAPRLTVIARSIGTISAPAGLADDHAPYTEPLRDGHHVVQRLLARGAAVGVVFAVALQRFQG